MPRRLRRYMAFIDTPLRCGGIVIRHWPHFGKKRKDDENFC